MREKKVGRKQKVYNMIRQEKLREEKNAEVKIF
jgi:hypothetical protein